MKTIKQQKASRRNFMLMSIVGMITMLKLFRDYYVKSSIYRAYLDEVITSLRETHQRLIYDKDNDPKNYLDRFYYSNLEKLVEKRINNSY